MEYTCKKFDNFNEFEKEFSRLALILSYRKGEGDWMEYELLYFPTFVDFSKYIIKRWLEQNYKSNNNFIDGINLHDYINYDKFGRDYCEENSELGLFFNFGSSIVVSSYGW